MALDERIQYWLEVAEYDLETAEAMLRIEPLLFVEGRDRSGFLRHIRSSGIKIY